MARHNRDGEGVDQRGHGYVVSYQPDWLRLVKVTRDLESGRQSTKTLFRNPAETRFAWRTGLGSPLGAGESLDTTGLEEGTRVELVVVASDGERESEPHVLEIRLAESSVEIALVAIDADAGTKPGAVLEAVVESTNDDADDFEVIYEWSVGHRVVGTHDELDTTALSPGDAVVLTARLDFDDRTSAPVSSQPVVLSRGEAPSIVSKPEGGLESGLFRYQMKATSPEPGAVISYSVSEGPEGLSVDAETGLVTWRPPPEQRGAFRIELVASDQWGTGRAQNFEIQLDDASPPASAR